MNAGTFVTIVAWADGDTTARIPETGERGSKILR